jgi:predicted GIY-YIG superfamily endonuclease
MFYVYILKSLKFDEKYTGYTGNLSSRLKKHNKGDVPHTRKFRPWKIIFYAAFKTEEKAIAFEKYLKSHSGIAFRNKRLI